MRIYLFNIIFRNSVFRIMILLFVFSTLTTFTFAQSINDLLIKAKIEFENNQFQNAIDSYTNILVSQPGTKELFFYRGECFFQQKQYFEALSDYKKADSLDNGFASFQIAKCYALLGNNSIAIEYIKKNLTSKYKEPQSAFKLEKTFGNIQKTKEWKDLWKQDWYSVLENSLAEIHYFYENNKFEKALNTTEQLLVNHKNNFTLLHFRGKILLALTDYNAAEKDFNELIQRKPFVAELYVERAEIYEKTNVYKKALEDYNKAIELDGTNYILLFKRALVLYNLKLFDNALVDLNRYTYFKENDQNALYYCGLIYFEKQEYFKALPFFNDLLEKNKKELRYFVARGNTYLMCTSYKYAEQDYTQALDLNPKSGIVYMNRGIARFEQGELKGACRDWQKAFNLKDANVQDYLEKRCKQ